MNPLNAPSPFDRPIATIALGGGTAIDGNDGRQSSHQWQHPEHKPLALHQNKSLRVRPSAAGQLRRRWAKAGLVLNLYSPFRELRGSSSADFAARAWRKRVIEIRNRVFDRARAIVAVQFVALRRGRGRWHKLCSTS